MRVASVAALLGLLSSVTVSLPIPSEHTSQNRDLQTPVYHKDQIESTDDESIEILSAVNGSAAADTVALSYIRNMTKHAWDSYTKYGMFSFYDFIRGISMYMCGEKNPI
jgi:hypothetical protein